MKDQRKNLRGNQKVTKDLLLNRKKIKQKKNRLEKLQLIKRKKTIKNKLEVAKRKLLWQKMKVPKRNQKSKIIK
jgi:hypothetical protein